MLRQQTGLRNTKTGSFYVFPLLSGTRSSNQFHHKGSRPYRWIFDGQVRSRDCARPARQRSRIRFYIVPKVRKCNLTSSDIGTLYLWDAHIIKTNMSNTLEFLKSTTKRCLRKVYLQWSKTISEVRTSLLPNKRGIFDNTGTPIKIDGHLLVIQTLASIAHALLDDEQHLANLSDIPGVLKRHRSCMTHVCKRGNELHNQTQNHDGQCLTFWFLYTVPSVLHGNDPTWPVVWIFHIPRIRMIILSFSQYYNCVEDAWPLLRQIFGTENTMHMGFYKQILVIQKGYTLTKKLNMSEKILLIFFPGLEPLWIPKKIIPKPVVENHFPEHVINHRQQNPATNL